MKRTLMWLAAACLLGAWNPPSKGEVAQVANDAWITAKIESELAASKDTKVRQIKVATDRGVVKLTGTVDSQRAAARAVDLAKGTSGVVKVISDLQYPTQHQPSRVTYPDGPDEYR